MVPSNSGYSAILRTPQQYFGGILVTSASRLKALSILSPNQHLYTRMQGNAQLCRRQTGEFKLCPCEWSKTPNQEKYREKSRLTVKHKSKVIPQLIGIRATALCPILTYHTY